MAGNYGIDNIKRVLGLVLEAGNVLPEIQEADSTISKFLALSKMGDELVEIVNVDIKTLKKEVLEMDAQDKAQILKFVEEKYKIPNKVMEAEIENAIKIGLDLMDGFIKAYDFWKKTKERIEWVRINEIEKAKIKAEKLKKRNS